MFTQNAVAAIFTNPVAISTIAVIDVHMESSSPVCASPENRVNGRTIPQIPRTNPPTTDLITSLSPNLSDTRWNALSDRRNSHPARAPTRHTGRRYNASPSPNPMPSYLGMDMPPPTYSPRRCIASRAPMMADAYVTSFIGLDISGASVFPDTPANPNSGAVNTADRAAYIPMSVSPFSSLPKLLIRSPTQVHNPAITPVSPASGPTEPPNTRGSTAPTDMTPSLSYSYRPFSFTLAMTSGRFSG